MQKDYYKILGVDKNSSEEEIKKAYRKLAHTHHPDKTGGEDKKFKEINEAYQVLGNKGKKAQYDQFGQTFEGGMPGGGAGQGFGGFRGSGFNPSDFGFNVNMGSNGGDFSDIFESIFDQFGGGAGGRRQKKSYSYQGGDIEVVQKISLEDSFNGLKTSIAFRTHTECKTCGGAGYKKEGGFSTCKKCGGKGETNEVHRTILGNFNQVTTCSECLGRGEIPKVRCSHCDGIGRAVGERNINVEIPRGVENGQAIKVKGAGEAGERGGNPGDLYIVIQIKSHNVFVRQGSNLFMAKDIKLADALLEKKVEIRDIAGENFQVTIPLGFDLREKLRVPGRGMPKFGALGGVSRGDLYIELNLKLPKKLSSKAKKALEEMEGEI